MFSRFFISQLRDKVLRGMKGAARRQTSVGRRLGYGLVPVLDALGRPVVGADERVVRERAIHSETMRSTMMATNWFALHEKNYTKIAKEFNRMKVDGSAAQEHQAASGRSDLYRRRYLQPDSQRVRPGDAQTHDQPQPPQRAGNYARAALARLER